MKYKKLPYRINCSCGDWQHLEFWVDKIAVYHCWGCKTITPRFIDQTQKLFSDSEDMRELNQIGTVKL